MVCLALVAFGFATGTFIFVVSLVAAPCTRRYCFTTSVRCLPIVKTFSSLIFPNIRKLLFLLVLLGFACNSVLIFV